MLKGHTGGLASNWEQWSNSLDRQFSGVMDTMSQSLRIKEEAYSNMFKDKEKVLKDSMKLQETIKILEEKQTSTSTEKPETDNAFLREKLKLSEEKLNKERIANANLFSTVTMMKKAAQSAPSGLNEDRIQFLASTNCIELVNPVDHKGEGTYWFDSMPAQVPLYGTDGVSFINTNNPKSVAMMMKLYSASWESLGIDKH